MLEAPAKKNLFTEKLRDNYLGHARLSFYKITDYLISFNWNRGCKKFGFCVKVSSNNFFDILIAQRNNSNYPLSTEHTASSA